jgi:hypothetical protein
VPRGDLVMRAEVGDPAVLDDQQPIGVVTRRFTLPSDMPQGSSMKSRNAARMPNGSLRDRVIALRTRQVALRFVPATSNGRATLSPRARPMARVEFRRSLRDVPC